GLAPIADQKEVDRLQSQFLDRNPLAQRDGIEFVLDDLVHVDGDAALALPPFPGRDQRASGTSAALDAGPSQKRGLPVRRRALPASRLVRLPLAHRAALPAVLAILLSIASSS